MNEYDATETAFKNGYEKAVREIFEEINEECFDQFGYFDYEAFFKLKKKYTEGKK